MSTTERHCSRCGAPVPAAAPRGSNRGLLVVLAFVAVVLVIGVVVVLVTRGDDETPTSTTRRPTTAATTAVATTTAPTTATPTTVPATTAPATTAAPTTTEPPATTDAPTTLPASVPATTVVEAVTLPDEPRPMPEQIDGYVANGAPQTETFRVFDDGTYATPFTFVGQMNDCGSAMWTARWTSANPSVTVRAARGPYDADITVYDLDPFDGEEGTAGYVSGFICERPVFFFGVSGDTSNLVDVDIEWQYWDQA